MVEKFAWIINTLAFYEEDMDKYILELDLVKYIDKIMQPCFSSAVRQTAI